MKVTQIHSLINSVTGELLGNNELLLEDLSNVVDTGVEIFNQTSVDNFVKKLVDRIGKTVFVDKKYNGAIPSILMDNWEYGSVLQKISAKIPEAKENDTWNLKDGQSYNDDIFYQPEISAKFFNSKVTFEINVSITERQVKSAFNSKEELNGLISLIYTSVENSMTIKLESLIMRTLNTMIAETIHSADGVKCVDLLSLYNTTTGLKLTRDKALLDRDFIRYATYTMNLYVDRLAKVSTLFNIGKEAKFTPVEDLNIVLLNDYASAMKTFMASDTLHPDNVVLPKYETVPYWQGSGTTYAFGDVSKINVKTSKGNTVEADGIIGVMFDVNGVGVCNVDKRVTTNYNAKAEFFTNYYKFDCGYFCDLNENFIVFTLGNSLSPAKAKA